AQVDGVLEGAGQLEDLADAGRLDLARAVGQPAVVRVGAFGHARGLRGRGRHRAQDNGTARGEEGRSGGWSPGLSRSSPQTGSSRDSNPRRPGHSMLMSKWSPFLVTS